MFLKEDGSVLYTLATYLTSKGRYLGIGTVDMKNVTILQEQTLLNILTSKNAALTPPTTLGWVK